MKNKFLFNPFLQIAGLTSLLIGLSGLFLTSYLAYKTGTHFNGLLSIDFAKDSDFWVFLVENGSQWIILSILLFAAGLILSKSKIRAIDIFGTTLFSRIPLIIVPLIRVFPPFQSFVYQSATMYFIIGIYRITLIWTIVLLFNAFKVSCNLKNEKLIVSFILCIILSEVFTAIFLHVLI
jgi:hypothetical protein